jgi:Cd(II)/Pb(II)-responsive transcriptional regulator
MRISELGRATGVDAETVRYYEKAGLMPRPGREANGYRAYGREHLERLAFIRHCRALDMSLGDIKRLLDFAADPGADCSDVDRVIDTQIERVRARLTSLAALERQLTALRHRCGARQSAATCGILNELVAAAHGEACVCHGPSTARRA